MGSPTLSWRWRRVCCSCQFLSTAIGVASSLRAIVVVSNADGTLTGHTVGPEAAELNVGLGDGCVGVQKPGTKDRLGQNVQYAVSDYLLTNGRDTGAICNTPDDL